MGLKDLIVWSIIGLQGLGLIFDGQSRNTFFSAISYVHNYSDKNTQDLAQILRIALGLLIASAFFGMGKGKLFKIIPLISFIVYFVFANNSVLMSKLDMHRIQNMIFQIFVFLLAIDSLINSFLVDDEKQQRTKKAVQLSKKLEQEAAKNQKTLKPEEKHKNQQPKGVKNSSNSSKTKKN